MEPVIIGRRRFTCLSPTLVRAEYAPDGVFEARRLSAGGGFLLHTAGTAASGRMFLKKVFV